MPPTRTHSQRKTKRTRFLSKSEFWSPLHTVLKKCVHRTVPTRFFFPNDTPSQYHTPASHLGYNLPDTQHSSPFESTPMPPPIDPYSENFTTVNVFENYGMPAGVAPPATQSTTISSISPSITPCVLTKERWYTEYNVDRDAHGLFHCPFAGCSKENKRRDQLWEHWKARHNDQPYRCTVWSVLQCRQSLIKRSNSELSNKTWIYNGAKAHMCNTEMTTCNIWFVDARCAWCIC